MLPKDAKVGDEFWTLAHDANDKPYKTTYWGRNELGVPLAGSGKLHPYGGPHRDMDMCQPEDLYETKAEALEAGIARLKSNIATHEETISWFQRMLGVIYRQESSASVPERE